MTNSTGSVFFPIDSLSLGTLFCSVLISHFIRVFFCSLPFPLFSSSHHHWEIITELSLFSKAQPMVLFRVLWFFYSQSTRIRVRIAPTVGKMTCGNEDLWLEGCKGNTAVGKVDRIGVRHHHISNVSLSIWLSHYAVLPLSSYQITTTASEQDRHSVYSIEVSPSSPMLKDYFTMPRLNLFPESNPLPNINHP